MYPKGFVHLLISLLLRFILTPNIHFNHSFNSFEINAVGTSSFIMYVIIYYVCQISIHYFTFPTSKNGTIFNYVYNMTLPNEYKYRSCFPHVTTF
jgi:hypothetical protein